MIQAAMTSIKEDDDGNLQMYSNICKCTLLAEQVSALLKYVFSASVNPPSLQGLLYDTNNQCTGAAKHYSILINYIN